MIHLPDNYSLSANTEEFTLLEKNAKGKYVTVGYYPTISALSFALSHKHLYRQVASLDALTDVLADFRAWCKALESPLLAELKSAVKAYGKTEALEAEIRSLKAEVEKLKAVK